jgi:hypothetical protein
MKLLKQKCFILIVLQMNYRQTCETVLRSAFHSTNTASDISVVVSLKFTFLISLSDESCYNQNEVFLMHSAQVGLAEAQQIKAVRKPNSSLAYPTQREAQSTQKTSPMGDGVALPFKVASSSQIKQGGIILRHLSPHLRTSGSNHTPQEGCGPRDRTVHLWTSGYNHTPQEGCGPQDRTVHHMVQGCPHHSHPLKLSPSSDTK